jgi:hypothetical protein
MKTTCIGRRPQILKVEYLSDHLLDHIQILNLSLDDQTTFLKILKMKTASNRRRPPMEDKASNGRRTLMEDNLHLKTTNGR